MIRDAVTSRRVVIEPFDAPPHWPPRGLTGRLSRWSSRTNSAVCRTPPAAVPQPRPLRSWTRDIKLEVPETGVSSANSRASSKSGSGMTCTSDGNLVELRRAPRADGPGNGVPPKTFSGSATEHEKLTLGGRVHLL